MTKVYEARADQIDLNGAMRNVPAYANGDQAADQPPYFIFSGSLDLVTAVADQGGFFFPMAAKVLAVKIRVRVAPGTAAANVYVGTTADNDRFSATEVATADTAGTVLTATILEDDIAANSVLVFGADGGATATGTVDVTVIWTPAK